MYEYHDDGRGFHNRVSTHEKRERGHGGPGGPFEHRGHWQGAFGPPPMGGVPGGEVRGFAFATEEGDDSMRPNSRDWRGGGPRGPGRQGFGFGRGPERPERPLEQGDLRWLVLDLISIQPRHGYEIIKAIEDLMNGHYTPSPGVIYPTLTFLEETGLIASEAQASKKLYSLTDEGRIALKENAPAIQAIRTRIDQTRLRFGGPPAPEMMRAMDNLRAAIHVRLAKGELSPESLAAVTAALDRAAGEIERS